MGGIHFQELTDLAVRIWEWCLAKEMVIHAEYLPGKENFRVDWVMTHVGLQRLDARESHLSPDRVQAGSVLY